MASEPDLWKEGDHRGRDKIRVWVEDLKPLLDQKEVGVPVVIRS